MLFCAAILGLCTVAHALLPRRIASLSSLSDDAVLAGPTRHRPMAFPKRYTHYDDTSSDSSSDAFSEGEGPALVQMLLSRLPHEAAIGRVRVYDDRDYVLQINIAAEDSDDLAEDDPTLLEALEDVDASDYAAAFDVTADMNGRRSYDDIEIALFTEARRLMLEMMPDSNSLAHDSEIDRGEDLVLEDLVVNADLFNGTGSFDRATSGLYSRPQHGDGRRARVLLDDTLRPEPEVPSAEEYSMLAIVTATVAGTLLVAYILFLMYKVVLEAVETQAMANQVSRPSASSDLSEEAPLLQDDADSDGDIESQTNATSSLARHSLGASASEIQQEGAQETPRSSPAAAPAKGRKKHRGFLGFLPKRLGHSKH